MILVDTIVLNSEHDGKDSIGMKDSAYTVGGLGAKKLQENGRQQDNLKAAVIDVFLHWSGNDISGQIFHRKMTEIEFPLELRELSEEFVKIIGPFYGTLAETTVD